MPYNPCYHERRILDLLCEGYQNNEIAREVNYSIQTIELRLHKLRKHFKARNRVHLAVVWTRYECGNIG